MRRTIARVLLAALTTACGSPEPERPRGGEVPAVTAATTAPADPGGLTGPRDWSVTADIGNTSEDAADSQLARQHAIESARNTGLLGTATGESGGMASLTGTGHYGTIGAGTGTGMGYGVGAGGGRRGRAGGHAPRPDPTSGESYKDYGANAWTTAAVDSLSTFAVDVDTASYTITRRKLVEGALPPAAAVRVEELVNYFKYSYAAPDAARPFSVAMDMAASPFDSKRHILRVGVSTKPLAIAERKPAHLVFLVDVSGSMQSPDKLGLAQRSLRILVDNLKDGDTVALVTYAGSTRVVLPPTGLEHKGRILSAIEDLQAGGSTGMAGGIELAYRQAAKGIRPGAISRVLVLSDGDANVGASSHAEILKLIAGKVKEGVTLSTVGFGTGNYKDELMEQLANKGNGNNVYIDGLSQARRVFQDQLGATLEVVAKDVKIQVDFDATRVQRYRLIGYENRDIADADFRNDRVDAGEIGAGHQVTALYEVELAAGVPAGTGPLATVRVRHKAPTGTTAIESAYPMAPVSATTFRDATGDLRFAFAVAAFADVLRGGTDAKSWDLATIKTIAADAADGRSERTELVQLIERAIKLRGGPTRVL